MLFPHPISFPVFKDGQTITATVTEETEHSVVSLFRVRFSDGFEEMFGIDHTSEKVISMEAHAEPYAKAIQYDLPQVMVLDPAHFWHVFQHEIDGALVNVWVSESRYEGQTIYMVAYKNEFRLALVHRNGQWDLVERSTALNDTDKEIMVRTGFMLDSLL